MLGEKYVRAKILRTKLFAFTGLLLLLSLNVPPALAYGKANSFKVKFVRVDRSGKGYVEFDSNLVANPPACTQSSYQRALAFDTNTAGGAAILSVALAAQASGRRIIAYGTHGCDTYSGVMEDWNWGRIID